MVHPLVTQLRFTRSEWVRGLKDVTPEEAVRRFEPINPISWMIAHLAWQEQRYFVIFGLGKIVFPEAQQYGFGQSLSIPPLERAWEMWRAITKEADVFLDGITPELLLQHLEYNGERSPETVGTRILRTTHHYWYHLGESQAVRQLLGHKDLPQFVGSMAEAAYTPE
jgi:hypothetical protein